MVMTKGWLIGLGVFFIIVAIIAYQIPLDVTIVGTQYSITIPYGVALCDSEIDPFDQIPLSLDRSSFSCRTLLE